MTALLAPLIVCLAAIWGLYRKCDVFSSLISGARSGLSVCAAMLPPLIVLLSGVYMLRASGILEAAVELLKPLMSLFGIPAEAAPLMLLRPFSGSGALAVGTDIISRFGQDSFVGRCAAVILGSTETTFYVIAVYFGSAGIKKTRRVVPAALAADITGFIMACLTVRLFF